MSPKRVLVDLHHQACGDNALRMLYIDGNCTLGRNGAHQAHAGECVTYIGIPKSDDLLDCNITKKGFAGLKLGLRNTRVLLRELLMFGYR